MSVDFLQFCLTVPWVGLQCVILVFPNHTYLLYDFSYIAVVVIDAVVMVSISNSGCNYGSTSTHPAVYCEKPIVRMNNRTQVIPKVSCLLYAILISNTVNENNQEYS